MENLDIFFNKLKSDRNTKYFQDNWSQATFKKYQDKENLWW